MLPARTSFAPSLEQYLNCLLESPTGSSKEDIGLPLSSIASPNQSTLGLTITAHKVLIPTLADNASETHMRLAPRSSQHFLARATSLQVPKRTFTETDAPKREKKQKIDDTMPATLTFTTPNNIGLAIAKTETLIREYSELVRKIYASDQGLNDAALMEIEMNFEAKKNAIFHQYNLPEIKINKCNRIINEHFNELLICLKNNQAKLVVMVIKSLNENFVPFSND